MSEQTVRVRFVDDTEAVVPAKDIHPVGEEGAQAGIALIGDREVPIYRRSEPEWDNVWVEQVTLAEWKAMKEKKEGD